MKGHGETILVVEDDKELRETVSDLLRFLGYRIFTAPDGEDGVRLFQEHRWEIDLVLLDAVMPRKNGFEAYKEMDLMRPGLPSLFVTGYNAARGRNDIEDAGSPGVLHKPYSIEMLSRIIRRTLDGKH